MLRRRLAGRSLAVRCFALPMPSWPMRCRSCAQHGAAIPMRRSTPRSVAVPSTAAAMLRFAPPCRRLAGAQPCYAHAVLCPALRRFAAAIRCVARPLHRLVPPCLNSTPLCRRLAFPSSALPCRPCRAKPMLCKAVPPPCSAHPRPLPCARCLAVTPCRTASRRCRRRRCRRSVPYLHFSTVQSRGERHNRAIPSRAASGRRARP